MPRSFLRSSLAFTLASLLIVSCTEESPVAPSPEPCTYSFAPVTAAVASSGGDGTVQVVTSASCDWTISSTVAWITLPSGNTARGTAMVVYRVAANTSDDPRTGTLRVESAAFSIAQAGRVPCAYEIDPTDRTFDSAGGTGTVAVSTRTDCPWSAVSDAAWLTITEGAQSLGSGTVTYAVARHDGDERRTSSIRIADKVANVTQEPIPEPPGPCEYSVTPVDIRRHWHQTEGQFTLATDPHCTWTAVSAAAWLGLSTPSNGVGAITMAFTNSIYTGDTPRRAAIEVRWPTPTAGQNVWVTQEGCWYALAPDTRDIGVAGGLAQIIVLASPASVDCNIGCPWTAQSLVPWLTITSSMPRSGDDGLFFRVDANTTGEPRVGQIRIEHLVLTIKQAGQ